MTDTNIFYNFVGFRYSPPLTASKCLIQLCLNNAHTHTYIHTHTYTHTHTHTLI